jgi:hypothetical protein
MLNPYDRVDAICELVMLIVAGIMVVLFLLWLASLLG